MKLANINLAHQKEDSQNDKRNFQPVSLLSNISKVFQNILNQQIYALFENIFSKQQTGFCQGLNLVHCLLVILKNFRKAFDKCEDYTALLTDPDLSKVTDCILMI